MNVGIVGCGFISGIHINAWKDAGLSVVAVCDLNEKAAMQFAKEWRIPSYYTNFSEMLKNEDLFAVSVCVPPTRFLLRKLNKCLVCFRSPLGT